MSKSQNERECQYQSREHDNTRPPPSNCQCRLKCNFPGKTAGLLSEAPDSAWATYQRYVQATELTL